MKKRLFDFVAWSTATSIWFTDIGVQAFLWLADLSKVLLAKGGIFLLNLIDADLFAEKVAEEEAQKELERMNSELELMSNATKLKEHALETGDWTDQHTIAIEAIGNALLNECDWEEEDVHRYLREVVETDTGLSYGIGAEEDDDPLY